MTVPRSGATAEAVSVGGHVTPWEKVLEALRSADCNPKRSGDGWQAKCPAHEDRNPSLSVSKGREGRALVQCHATCSTEDVLAAIDLKLSDLYPDNPTHASKIVAKYDYRNEAGGLAYQVVRYQPKGFRQRVPDGLGWRWSMKGVDRIPYRLPELIAGVKADHWIVLLEGEKDCENLVPLGFVATCNAGGAGKWDGKWSTYFGGAKVAIIPDNDRPGRKHAQHVASYLAAVASVVKVIALPDLAEHGDVSDWLAAGGTADELKKKITVAPPWSPEAERPEPLKVSNGPYLMFREASEITPTKPNWLWPNWLEMRSLHLLIGRQGCGKSTLAAWVVSTLSSGRPWPDESQPRESIRCAMLSLEEPDERLVARLHAAGADVGQVLILGDVEERNDDGRPYQRPWRLPEDCGVLEARLTSERLGLVVVDGLGYSITGDSHNYANVGSSLSALAGVAERTGCAILGLTHPPKGASDPVTAAIGSTAWTAIPRLTWVLGIDPEDETRRVMRVGKTNYAEPTSGFAFGIAGDDRYEAGYVADLVASTVTAEDLTAATPTKEDRTEREEARKLIRSLLAPGAMDSSDLMKLARAAGLSESTVKRARGDLKVISEPRHDPTTGRTLAWSMRLPNQMTITSSSPEGQPPFGPVDPLAVTRTSTPSSCPEGQPVGIGPLGASEPKCRFPSCDESVRNHGSGHEPVWSGGDPGGDATDDDVTKFFLETFPGSELLSDGHLS